MNEETTSKIVSALLGIALCAIVLRLASCEEYSACVRHAEGNVEMCRD